jgi:hypothetical protein
MLMGTYPMKYAKENIEFCGSGPILLAVPLVLPTVFDLIPF